MRVRVRVRVSAHLEQHALQREGARGADGELCGATARDGGELLRAHLVRVRVRVRVRIRIRIRVRVRVRVRIRIRIRD